MNTYIMNEKTQVHTDPRSSERINPNLDRRVQMIYERYSTGKTIIMDDLYYLWSKDPEGCDKLARSIVDTKIDKHMEGKPNNLVNVAYVDRSIKSTKEQENHIDYVSSPDAPVDNFKQIQDTMKSVKLIIERMNESERMDMLKNLNESFPLTELANNMKYWDDSYTDKMVMYTYKEEKEFSILA